VSVTSSQVLVLLGVVSAVWLVTATLRRAVIPTAVVLVVAGGVIGFLPFFPDVTLSPRLALDAFLPPLVFYSAYWTSPRAIVDDGLRVGLLSVGLVALTACTVAVAAHDIGGLSWPMSFVLGTAVGPTDAVAASSIAANLGLPQRLSTLLQSEAMFNDATALVLYAAAVTAATTGHFSVGRTSVSIGYAVLVGAAVGLGVGVVGDQLRRRIDDPPMEIVLSVLVAYGAYLPAETLRASGVLAGVTAGLYLGWNQPASMSASSRLQSRGFWDTAEFLLNAALFILLGLSLHAFTATARGSVGRLVFTGLGVVVAVVAVRLIWTSAMSVAPRQPNRRSRPKQHRAEHLVIGWSGMRGGLTLAAVLAVPETTASGVLLSGRDDVIYLAFAVIFATLIGQGLTLPLMARRLRSVIEPDNVDDEQRARAEILQSAREVLDGHAEAGALPPEVIDAVRRSYDSRFRRAHRTGLRHDASLHAELALHKDLLASQRRRLVELRADGLVGSTAFRAIQHDLDLDEARLLSDN
jgi:CPA1 family monovalent cation:H+ antiporter